MLSEYMDMNNFLPTLSSEVVHRVVEILKFFNTRTCQLILGAGAMQVKVRFAFYNLLYFNNLMLRKGLHFLVNIIFCKHFLVNIIKTNEASFVLHAFMIFVLSVIPVCRHR
jgi:hypothetical protein